MNKYTIRINCVGFRDIEVEAENERDAIEEAKTQFNCPDYGGEFNEIISVENI